HRPQLTSIVALMTSSTVLAAWPHVLFASFLVAWLAQIAWVPSTPTCSRPPSRRTSRSARTPGAGAAAVERAAALAGAAPFIEALPRGYDTPLVSAGCACRPGSGRRSPRPAPSSATPRCCWNQPAAHLDPLRPAASRAALEGLMAGRTVVPVTHRPGQAPATSRLLRLDHGRLAQDSRHLPALTARPTLAMTP
ncbi:MAG TPA: hypothetical protein VFX25_21230, partial [Streptosporangiaceae bacterium]|nr:hypothetical protein [Streptosporangiaceae bacterium]